MIVSSNWLGVLLLKQKIGVRVPLRSRMKIFFLDDDKERHRRFTMNRIGQDVTAAWTYAEAVELLSKEIFDLAYLDHDLSDFAASGHPLPGEKTGTDVAEFITQMPEDRRPRKVIIHSFNPYGAERMEKILRTAGIEVLRQKFKE